jgi:hypothetical protein
MPAPHPPAAAPDRGSPALAGAAEVVGLVRRLADAQGRDDLAAQLDGIRRQLAVRPVPVVVVGAPGTGRSSLVNALVGAPVSPAGTVVPVEVAHACAYTAAVAGDDPGSAIGGRPGATGDLPFGEAMALATAAYNPQNRWRLRAVHLGVPATPLVRGLTLVDTPAVTRLSDPATLRIVRAMAGAAAVVVTAPADRPLTDAELDLARVAQAMSRRVVVALTGADRVTSSTVAVDAAQVRLDGRAVSAAVFAVDTAPYWTDAGGLPPGPDPGLRALARHLEEAVVLDGEQQRISRALTEAFWAADRLRLRLWAEEALIERDGDAGDGGLTATIARLRGAARAAQALCGDDAGWHRDLRAGIRRLALDVAADGEAQLGRIATTSDDRVDDHDVAEALVRLQRVRTLALRALVRQVAGRFREEWAAVVGSLDLGAEAHSLLLPRLERPTQLPATPLAELPLDLADDAAGADSCAADRVRRVVAADTSSLLDRAEADLGARCRDRAVELHRSLVEVLTALTILRDADDAARSARRDALASGLAQLDVVDWRGADDDRR